jgi:hypothetical protein
MRSFPHHTDVSSNKNLKLFLTLGLLLAAILLVSVISLHQGKGFASAEVKFTDASESGLAIVPASCPSTPDYTGQCNTPPAPASDDLSCGISTSPTTISPGQTATLYWTQGAGYSPFIPPGSNIYVIYDNGQIDQGIGGVPQTGSRTIGPFASAQTIKYTYSGNSHDAINGVFPTATFTFSCDATLVVSGGGNCANGAQYYSQALPLTADGKGYYAAPGITQAGAYAPGAGMYVCVTNTSSNRYFIPANTANELSTFKTVSASLPGLTVW